MEPERQERQKRDTRRVYWLLGFVVAGVLIVIGYQFLADDPPVADAAFLKDLNLPPKPVSNPLSEYQDWLDAHRPAWQLLFGGFTIARGFGEVTRDLAGISANPKIAGGAAFFEETNSHFERLAALLETDPKQWHWRSFSGGANVHMIRNEPSAISGVWDLLRARAGVLRAQNATAQALEECLLCLRFAELLEDRPGTTSHLSVVGRLRATAVENVAECLRRGPATTGSDLRRLRERLPRREGKSRMVRDALLCDYLTVRNSLKSLPHEQLVGSLPVSPAYSMLKRNRTTRLCLESSQAYEGALPAGLVAIEKEHRSLESRKRATGRFSWLPLRASNASGWEIWAAFVDFFPAALECHSASVFALEIARLQLATREFELSTGNLPRHIEDLVPAFIEQVPEDPFFSGCLQWSLAAQAFYSRGEDGLDDGGDIDPSSPASRRMKDMGEHYWWKRPPAAPSAK